MDIDCHRVLAAAAAVLLATGLLACGSPGATEPAATAGPSPALPERIPPPSNESLIARARALELATPYEPPPGDPLEHDTSGYAKTMRVGTNRSQAGG